MFTVQYELNPGYDYGYYCRRNINHTNTFNTDYEEHKYSLLDTEVITVTDMQQVQYMNKHIGDVTHNASGTHTVAFVLECKGAPLNSILEPRPFIFHFETFLQVSRIRYYCKDYLHNFDDCIINI